MLERCERKILLGWRLLELPNRVTLFVLGTLRMETDSCTNYKAYQFPPLDFV